MHNAIIVALLVASASLAFDHSYANYNAFLAKYVCEERVAYKKIGDDPLVNSIVAEFESLTRDQFLQVDKKSQLAFLINAYNFYTIVLIKDHYPLKTGIKDISKPWDQKFITLFGRKVSLNHIEHDLLRKEYDEPRIHFAIVCASIGCPGLSNQAFVSTALDKQLDKVASRFLHDTTKNQIKNKTLYISKIFSWFGDDFNNQYGGYQNYIKSVLNLSGKYKIKFLKYDWHLNETTQCK